MTNDTPQPEQRNTSELRASGEITPEMIEAAANNPRVRELLELKASELMTFQPRKDNLALGDMQSSFCDSTSPVSVLLGGNGSGKSTAAAYKVAKFLCQEQPPPRRDCPYWVISDTYEQCIGIGWAQGLRRFIPPSLVDWSRVQWLSSKAEWPSHVPLKPWPGRPGKNWVIEFKSTEQRRQKFQGRSIGGAWFSEQFPWEILEEVIRGLRDTWYPGSVIIECTPIDPDLSIELEELYDNPPLGWSFYSLNTMANSAVSKEWKDAFFSSVSDEMVATRREGKFASYRGQIYKSFNPHVHLVGDNVITHPNGVQYVRAIDWGGSAEHPFVCLWGYVDGTGRWFIFDELWDDTGLLSELRAELIKDRFRWFGGHAQFGPTYCDPSRPDLLNEFSARGIPTSSARNDVHRGIECVRQHLKLDPLTGQPSLYIHKENCPHLAKEMRKYRWLRASGKGLNPASPRHEPLKKEDDCVDTLRYMIFSHVQKPEAPGTTSLQRSDPRRFGIQLKRADWRPRTFVQTGYDPEVVRRIHDSN
ncbi:Terminase-like family protein [Symmachiella dynata]|uniref:Terminase-like family protein n=1 Tax=Symmachiella dynata TaxID=2527995 RepID=A0A517ZVT9_9PLAN|nr:terminase family protein [Symmachiella dynata]QDU46602.1 Terminase-like family protein [Symmachiella dynata]